MTVAAKQTKAQAAATRAAMRSLTQQQAAELIGKSRNWLADHPEVGGRNDDGTYDGPRLVAAVVRKADLSQIGDRELKRREAEARTRKEEAQAARIEQQTAQEAGSLIQLADVETAIGAIVSSYSEHFMGIADKVAPQLPADIRQDVVAVIRNDIARTLTGIAEELQRKVLGKTEAFE